MFRCISYLFVLDLIAERIGYLSQHVLRENVVVAPEGEMCKATTPGANVRQRV